MLILLEGLVMCFLLLLPCVIGIANGPAGLVVFYEKDVQDRVVELGYTTREAIKKRTAIVSAVLMLPMILLVPYMVYGINGATGFRDGFVQMTLIFWIEGLFDRFFIDWWWVGHTKAWLIPGTEDLLPYIPAKVCFKKWFATLVVYPVLAAVLAGVVSLIMG